MKPTPPPDTKVLIVHLPMCRAIDRVHPRRLRSQQPASAATRCWAASRFGPGRRVTEQSGDMGNTFSHTRTEVFDAVAGDVTHGSMRAVHRGLSARRLRRGGAG